MKKLILVILACVICPDVFAGVFNVISTDKSQQYLSLIFGNSVGSVSLGGSTYNQTLSLMFEKFNFIILTVGSVVLGYTAVISTINTAREGEALGKKLSAWVILRSVGGMLFMVPGPSSGYSVVQMTVMWIVLNGVGAANSIWNVILSQLQQQISVVGIGIQLPASSLFPLAQGVLNASVCMNSINNYMPSLSNNPTSVLSRGGAIKVYTQTYPPSINVNSQGEGTISQKAAVAVGMQGVGYPFETLCGLFIVNTKLDSTDTKNTFNLTTLNQRLQIKTQALLAMFSALDSTTQLLANPVSDSSLSYIAPDEGGLLAAGNAYISQISQLAAGVKAAPASTGAATWEKQPSTIKLTTFPLVELRKYGWIHAGSYYYGLVLSSLNDGDPETQMGAPLPTFQSVPNEASSLDANTGMPSMNSPWPTLSAQGVQPGIVPLLSSAPNPSVLSSNFNTALGNSKNYYLKDMANTTPPTRGLSVPSNAQNPYINGIVSIITEHIQTPLIGYLVAISTGDNFAIDPLVSLGQFGQNLMLGAEAGILLSLAASIGISLAVSSGSCLSPLPWGVNFLFTQVMPLIYGLAILCWTAGATLGVYLPLVPYLMFTTSAFGWIIAVVEAVVGAPLIALGLVHPSGDELGKAGNALVIVANVFLRPTLMIFGLVLGGGLLRAGIAMVNFGFEPAIQSATFPSMFSFVALILLYMFLLMALVNKSFSLIYMLPNQIMRWMGGPTETFDPGDIIKEAKAGFDAGASKVQAGGEEALKSMQSAANKIGQGKKGGGPSNRPPPSSQPPGGAPPGGASGQGGSSGSSSGESSGNDGPGEAPAGDGGDPSGESPGGDEAQTSADSGDGGGGGGGGGGG